MKVYIAYKFAGNDKEKLKDKLENISNQIESQGHSTFIYFRDVRKWDETLKPIKEVMSKALPQLDSSDALFAYVDSEEKSEGLIFEAGYAIAKGKKFYLAIKKGINLRILKALATQVIEFEDELENFTI